MGPGGRDGYLHIADATALLRMEKREISEVVVRVEAFDTLATVAQGVRDTLAPMRNKRGRPMFEVHTWDELSPFYNVVRMIDVMTLGIKAILVAVVLISILNVMMMSVYERIREIGTLAAMGTPPGRIMGLFVAEGFLLGSVSALAGAAVGLGILWALNLTGVEVAFGRSGRLFQLSPAVAPMEVISVCLVVLAISVLASLQPAAKAARLDPVASLRHV
jgi:putative ABC transport system permease protein